MHIWHDTENKVPGVCRQECHVWAGPRELGKEGEGRCAQDGICRIYKERSDGCILHPVHRSRSAGVPIEVIPSRATVIQHVDQLRLVCGHLDLLQHFVNLQVLHLGQGAL